LSTTTSAKSTSRQSNRLVSLDVMRGVTMASMILVNNPGDWKKVHPPLLHAHWHGCTFTDLVFPFFLFMVGAAMPFSFERRLEYADRIQLLGKVLWRSAILFAIGFVLGLLPDVLWNPNVIYTCRIPGVLQRIAICYFAVGLLALYSNNLGRWIASATLITVYTLGMLFFPVPGHGAGSFDVVGNFCWWLDNRLLFGHTYSGSPAAGFDPEGVWSTLTAIAGTQFGYFAGQVLRREGDSYQKATTIFVCGQLALLAGYVVSFVIPINKQLWTTSYLFLVTGFALNILALLYVIIDIYKWRRGLTFWLVLGTNSILAYILSSVLGDFLGLISLDNFNLKSWIVEQFLESFLSPKNASLAWALSFLALCWLLIWPLYRANWRFRI
jgi:predicted acyltransferase